MLESLVSTLLNRVLGAYVSNLNYNQLQIGIWSGEVVLRNLKLKREALDKLDLPVDVLEGHLGELTLNIPWSNLKGKPVMVYIKDVYVLAGPRSESTMTADELDERQYQQKMRKVANSELVKPISDAKNETFAEQLTTKILNNLQFSVTNIHVRYEDNVSAPQRFAAGITLSELSAISTDENWMPQTIGDAINTIHKLATLESLSIYWNTNTRSLAKMEEEESNRIFKELIATKAHIPSEHQYILKPVSGTGRIKMSKQFAGDVAKVDATLLFDELSFVIDDEQYRDTILMVDLFHSYLKKQKYLHLHPGHGVTPRTNPKRYFQFAANAVLSEIHDRNYRWTWDHFKKRRDDRLAYIDCYVDSQLNRASQEQLDMLDELEHRLSYEDIRFYRSRAKSRLKREMAILAEEEKRRKEAAQAQQAATGGWLGSWWYGGAPDEASGQVANQDLVITDEQKQEFYDAIEYDEDKAAAIEAVDFAKDTMKLSLRTTLNTGSFTIKRNPHAGQPAEVISLIFDTVILGAIQYVDSFKASAALGDLRLYDGVTRNTQYRQLIGAKEKAEHEEKSEGDNDAINEEKRKSLRRRSNVDPQLLKYSSIQDPFFSVVFEHKPLDGRADNGVALVMRNIDIVYNPLIIREVIDFFTPPETSADSINALIEVAGDTLEDIKNQTRVNLEYALEQHTTLDLKVDMDAPVIVIPEDCTAVKSRGIVIDAGHINVESDLAPLEVVQQIKTKRATDYTSDDYVRLRSLMYDKFAVHLTQTKILIGESVETCMDQVRNPKKENNYLHLVDRIDMTFLVEMCIIRNSTDLTNLKVSGHLPLLAVNFSDIKYRILMEIPRLIEASGILNYNRDQEQENEADEGDDYNNRLMHTRLWEQAEKELVLDSESDEEGSSTLVSHSTAASGKRANVHQRIFELNFRVDQASANIFQASNDGRETLLCDLVLRHLSVDYRLRPYDMRIEVSLKSLDVTDRMKHGNEFKYLVTSDQEVLHNASQSDDAKELVHVDYIRVDKSSPEYYDKYKGMDQTATVALSTLNFIVTRSSVLTLYNFVLNTFVDHELIMDARAVQNSPQQQKIQQQNSDSHQRQQQQQQQQSIRVTLLLDSVNFILNNDGVRLATAELSHGDMTTVMAHGTTQVAAKFANFTLTDDLSPPAEPQQQKSYDSRQLLTIQGEELIDLRFETFVDDEYDQSLYIKMGSAQFTFLEQPVRQLLEFLSKFAAMKSVYDRARQAALESAQQFQQSAAKTHFDIVIQTPVVLFPEMHEHPLDVVVAHLGEIKTSNTFMTEQDMCMNVIKADVRAINLTSKYYHPGRSPGQIHLQTLPIIDDIDLSFDIKSIHEALSTQAEPRPDITICSSVTDIRMHLTDRQYTFLMDAANMFSRVFGGGPATEESSETPSPPPLPRRKETSPSLRKSITSPPPPSVPDKVSTTAKQKQKEQKAQQPRLKMSLASKTIGLNLYMSDPTNTADALALVGLSGIALNDTTLQILMQKDDTMSVALKIVSMTIDDTRPNIKSKFKHIMPVTENGHQFEMQLDISAPNPTRHGIAMITVADPKVVLSLDHTFLLYNFFMRPFEAHRRRNQTPHEAVSSPSKKQQQAQEQQEDEEEQGMEIYYRIHINNPEFILLATPDETDSEAVVLSAEQVMFSRQAVMALVVRQVGMFLCRMDMRQTSTLKFIQTFDVSLSMNNNSGQTGPMTELEIDVEALVLRLSSRDAMLITGIFNKAYELYSASASIVDQQMQQIVSSVGQSLMHESLRASFQGLQVILIEEIHEMPMVDINIKPFSVDVANWSRALSVNVTFSMFMNYFNTKNSHWEPLLEPWSFDLKLDRKTVQDPLHIKLISNRALNANITHTFLESAVATLMLWDKQKEAAYSGERGTVAPYRLRNCTGYRLHVWNRDSPEKMVVKTLDDGADMPWWFEDWRERRETTTSTNNMLSVQLDGALWETLRNVPVDIQGEHTYSLRPRINDVQHRVVFDVKLVNNLKVVTIRSAMVIENRTLLPVEVGLLDDAGQKLDGPVKKIPPGEDYALPIERAYHNRFCIRPDAGFGYTWIDHALHWKNFASTTHPAPKTIQCKARDGDMPPFIFQIHARLAKKDVYYGQYPNMKIRLSAPIEVENLLPYDFNFRIIDKTSGQDFSSFLRKGGTTPLHVIENGHLLLMNIHMPDSEYSSSEFAIISTRGTEDLNIDDSLQLTSKDNVRLTLRINTIDMPDSGGARKYVIYCPYVMMNKSGCAIAFKPKVAWQSTMFSGPQGASIWKMLNKPEPFMFSYPKLENSNRSLIQVSGSDWSEPLSLEAVGSVQDVTLPKVNGTEEVHLGISVQEGQGKYKLTKVITFTPRFVLSNQMGDDVRYREPESRVDHELGSNRRIPLYNLRKNAEKQLSIKLPGINNTWSAPFNIQDIGTVHVRLESADESTSVLMRVTTILENATVFIILNREASDAWPYRIVNQTDEDMTFYQEDPIVILRDDYTENRMRNHRTRRYRLPAHQTVPYSWDMPAVKDKKLILNIGGRERSINMQEIGSQLPFRHVGRDGRQAITAIDIKTSQSTQILYLTPYNQSQSYFRPLTSQVSLASASSQETQETVAREGFETVDVKPVIHFVVELKMSQFGISMVNKRLQEIAYVTFRGLELKFTESNMYQSVRWNIKWVQIDNQLYDAVYPILLYPTNVTAEGKNEILPTFQLGLDRVKDNSHGVLYFKYFSVLLQEMSVELDSEFIFAVIDFVDLGVEGWNDTADDAKQWEFSTDIPDVTPQDNIAQLYFEMLNIQPITFDLSFMRTDKYDDQTRSQFFIVDVLTMAIGSIQAAPLRFNALAVENLRASGPDLANRIYIHYSNQFVNQLHMMLGSADIIGNPIGLFNNLSSGVAELYYESWQGFIYSDRPQDLGIGIARGFSGLLRKSVFGFTDSFSKFTASMGKGLSAVAMDREYLDRRRMNMTRNRPRHAFIGVVQGANYFANGLISGATGLVTQPIAGARKGGVGGFATGMYKGILGAVAKPVGGVFDMASNVGQGIRNSTTPTDTNDIVRIRFPRYIGPDGILKPYSVREAQGQVWLKDVERGQYFNDVYIAHCPVQSGDERVAMLTSNRLMLIRTSRLAVEWQEPFTEIQTIKAESTGIAIYLRSMSWEPFLVIPDKTVREWFFKRIEEAVLKYNAKRRPSV
ncbi:hypothetical protein BDB00DRAFT_946102 [Zychaea mexicana]|uniref:uncharacterized protein n=1 Tax=Zychaea mexicana TaxID=64656 RepID=UPI0022FE8C63|nr:uncharacterized protein BDB00DRAFT_946102 [Zychaea mexicana]KAI9493351.1 hypothetical protein BDB00DRAFT_946102 [Zychaea mexicana]